MFQMEELVKNTMNKLDAPHLKHIKLLIENLLLCAKTEVLVKKIEDQRAEIELLKKMKERKRQMIEMETLEEERRMLEEKIELLSSENLQHSLETEDRGTNTGGTFYQ